MHTCCSSGFLFNFLSDLHCGWHLYWLPIAVARSILPELLLGQIWHWGFLAFHIEWEEWGALAIYAKFRILTVNATSFSQLWKKHWFTVSSAMWTWTHMAVTLTVEGPTPEHWETHSSLSLYLTLTELFQPCLSLSHKACINSPDFFLCLDIWV